MIYIVLDTCVFAELIKEIEYDDILNQIIYWDAMNAIKLVVPTVILDEWERNKSNFEKYRRNILKRKIDNMKEIVDLIDIEITDLEKKVKSFSYDDNSIKEMNRIDELLNKSENIPISDNCKIKAAEYALQKLAPFKTKNSMGDALIIFSTVEFLSNKSDYDAYFISHNTKDFSQSKNDKSTLHSDLVDDFNKVKLKYYSHIRTAINELVNKFHLPTRDLIPQLSDFLTDEEYDDIINKRISILELNEDTFKRRLAQNSGYIDIQKSSFQDKEITFKDGFANTEHYAIKKCIEETGRVFRDFTDLEQIKVLIPTQNESKVYKIEITRKAYEEYFDVNFDELRKDIKNWRAFLSNFYIRYKDDKEDMKEDLIEVENEA